MKSDEKEFWFDYNDICKQCLNKCKQSIKVKVLSCNKIIKKEENKEK